MRAATLSAQWQSAREGYWWINAIGLGLTCVIAWMSAHAYAAIGAPLNAAICIICQLLAIASAILARRALKSGAKWTLIAAIIAAAGCAWWASKGLALAWEQSGQQADVWMVFFLAALEPGLFLMAENVKEQRSEQHARLATERQEREREEHARSERDRIRALAAAGVPTIGALTHSAHATPVSAHVTTPESLTERGAQVSCYRGHADARSHALALKADGMSAAECARTIGKPHSTVSRWFREADKRAG